MSRKFVPDKTHRHRRIASDEAGAWARNLRLRNSLAKLVLHMLTGYVNGDGVCIVGIPALSEDTELAQETVRRRLAWLEEIGAIVRIPQWVDEKGNRNSEGRGRRTSDEIRLMIDADIDLIEARAAGDVEAEQQIAAEHETAADPLPQTGSAAGASAEAVGFIKAYDSQKNLAGPPSDPLATPQLRRGPESFEPEPEGFPPTPPSGGGGPDASQGEDHQWPHAESWARAEQVWGEPVLHQAICRQIWSVFTDAERDRFFEVMRGYNAWRGKQKRPPNRCNLQKLMRERDAWPRFESLAPPKPKPPAPPKIENWLDEGSIEHRALCIMAIIAKRDLPRPLHRFGDPKRGRGIRILGDIPAGAAAIAALAEFDQDRGDLVSKVQWCPVERGTAQYVAWSERVAEWIGRMPESYRIWLDQDGNVVPTAQDAFKKDERSLPRCKEGLLVPCEWPPPKGTGKPKSETGNELEKTG